MDYQQRFVTITVNLSHHYVTIAVTSCTHDDHNVQSLFNSRDYIMKNRKFVLCFFLATLPLQIK